MISRRERFLQIIEVLTKHGFGFALGGLKPQWRAPLARVKLIDPQTIHSQGLDAYVVQSLDLKFKDVDWTAWDALMDAVHHPEHELTVALVGKYVDLPDAYLSVTEALRAGGFAHRAKVGIRWVAADECATPEGAAVALADYALDVEPDESEQRRVLVKIDLLFLPLASICVLCV